MASLNLTESRIRELPLGSGIWRDQQVKGLMVICHATTKTYSVQGDVRRNGRHVRMKVDASHRARLNFNIVRRGLSIRIPSERASSRTSCAVALSMENANARRGS
jgi:hypothetical protein